MVTFLFILLILMAIVMVAYYLHNRSYVRTLKKMSREKEQIIRDLVASRERAVAADKAKTMFVHNMSHEIRTPLNAIVGFSQLLGLPDGMLEPEEKETYNKHVINNSKLLTMLVDDILNSSDMEAGRYSIQLEDAPCNDICRATIQSVEHRTPAGVQMTFTTELADDFVINTDPRRVQQVLINFLTNACKHTKEGEINLNVSLDQDRKHISFAVTDTGCGIPEGQAEAVFERFTKLNAFVQGTGLGLNICRKISGLLGGRVYLDTSYKKGARFVLELGLLNK